MCADSSTRPDLERVLCPASEMMRSPLCCLRGRSDPLGRPFGHGCHGPHQVDDSSIDMIILDQNGDPRRILCSARPVTQNPVPVNDRQGDPGSSVDGHVGAVDAAIWPRLQVSCSGDRPSHALRTRMRRFTAMLGQPRLRFLLADGARNRKTIMGAMFATEGRRRIPDNENALFVVPAHLVTKWGRICAVCLVWRRRFSRRLSRTPVRPRSPRFDVDRLLGPVPHNPDVSPEGSR